jgi:hypothetical protein
MSGGKSRKEAGERKAENESPSRACTDPPARTRAIYTGLYRSTPRYWPKLVAEADRVTRETGRPTNPWHIREQLLLAWAGLA